MKIEIDTPDYTPESGLRLEWEPGFTIVVELEGEDVVVRANQEGLISLARHLLALAQSQVPVGSHIHFDESNSLEDGSCELVLAKI